MKKLFICAFAVALTACTSATQADIVNDVTVESAIPTQEETVDTLLKLGWRIYEMHCQCADLTISDDIIDRLEANNSDIDVVIDMVAYLEAQHVFGDTIGETDEWEDWCYYVRFYKGRE